MKLNNNVEHFFDLMLTQTKDLEEQLAIRLMYEGYMLPEHLSKISWNHVDMETNAFKSTNFHGTFWVKMSDVLRNILATHSKNTTTTGLLFEDLEKLNLLLEKFYKKIQELPAVADFIIKRYNQRPKISVDNIHWSFEQQSFTRDCFDPWQTITASSKGEYTPCCFMHIMKSPNEEHLDFSSKKLRKNLLDGKLNKECLLCHIRPEIDIETYNQKVEQKAKGYQQSRLESFPLRSIRIEITSNCNLRCTYCYLSHPKYKGEDITDVTFENTLSFLKNAPKDVDILLNGYGETTSHPNWKQYAQEIIELGYKPEITTNLSKNYEEDEIAILAKFKHIQISLDSHDEKMMQTIRKAVRPSKVFKQIEKIRESAIEQGVASPYITFSTGVYDPSVWTMKSFMQKLVELDIKGVTFWNIAVHEHNKTTRSIFSLPPEEFEKAKNIMHDAFRFLRQSKISYDIPGEFVEDIEIPDASILENEVKVDQPQQNKKKSLFQRLFKL